MNSALDCYLLDLTRMVMECAETTEKLTSEINEAHALKMDVLFKLEEFKSDEVADNLINLINLKS